VAIGVPSHEDRLEGVDQDAAVEAEETLIQAFAHFVRSVSRGERGNMSPPQALLSIGDAAKT